MEETRVAPVIEKVTLSDESVGQYCKLDLTLELSARYDNPHEPSDIAVDASFRAPSGRRVDVPGFFYEDFDLTQGDGLEELIPSGRSAWKIRFAPNEVGQWTFGVTVRSREGIACTPPATITCVPSRSKGFVRVSPKDTRYFAWDNGEEFFCIGSNAARFRTDQYVASYEELFAKMQKARMNWVRVWIPNIEKEAGTLVHYDQREAYRIDALLQLAETYGIYLDFCMDWWRTFDTAENQGKSGAFPADHAYWTGTGGKCERAMDFFTLPWAKAQYKKRLRYTVARWGYSPNVFCWEFWNEINCVAGYEPDYVTAWTAEMARELRQIDPWQHLITNSFGSFMVEPTMWRLPEIDFVKVHGYYHPSLPDYDVQVRGRDMGDFVPHWVGQIRDFGKPVLQGEYGMVNEDWGLSPYCLRDEDGIAIHNGIWAALHAGAAGTAMYWWTRDTIMPLNLYHIFTPIAAYLDDVRLTEWKLQPCEITTSNPQIRALGLKSDERMLIWLQNREHTWWNRVVEAQRPTPVADVVLDLGPLVKGRYRIEIWDTNSGAISDAETLDYHRVHRYARYRLPMTVEKDVALKVTRIGGL